MKWFQVSVRKLVGMSADKPQEKKLEDALDFKYGNYDYNEDARSVSEVDFSKKFRRILDGYVGSLSNKNILVAGSNDGYEIPFLNGAKVTALDLSGKALNKLKEKYPEVEITHANIESMPFPDNSFDLYISLRSIHSSNIDLEKALAESFRVVRKGGTLMYSVSNAYRNNGNLIKGIYIPSTQKLDEKKPYDISGSIRTFLEKQGLKPEIVEIPSEIFVIAKK